MSTLWAFSGALLIGVLLSLLLTIYVMRQVAEETQERLRRDEILARMYTEIVTRADINAAGLTGVQQALYRELVVKEPPAQTFDVTVTVTPRKGT